MNEKAAILLTIKLSIVFVLAAICLVVDFFWGKVDDPSVQNTKATRRNVRPSAGKLDIKEISDSDVERALAEVKEYCQSSEKFEYRRSKVPTTTKPRNEYSQVTPKELLEFLDRLGKEKKNKELNQSDQNHRSQSPKVQTRNGFDSSFVRSDGKKVSSEENRTIVLGMLICVLVGLACLLVLVLGAILFQQLGFKSSHSGNDNEVKTTRRPEKPITDLILQRLQQDTLSGNE